MTPPKLLALAAALLLAAPPAPAAELAPGDPPLTQELADLRRDAAEVAFDVQFTARQLKEHEKLYARCWKFSAAAWQKAERDLLPAFKGAADLAPAARAALRNKHRPALLADAKARAEKGSPYHLWLLATAGRAAEIVAAGPPALRRDAIDNALEFVQWGLRMQLTVRQQEDFMTMVPREWDADTNKAGRDSLVSEFLPTYRKVVRLTPADRDRVRAAVDPLFKEMLGKPESALDRWLVAAHADAGKVLAKGPPDDLTGGGTAQHADFYDWALGIRMPDAARATMRELIRKDWEGSKDYRGDTLRTAKFMDDPPRGGAGELLRLTDFAATLLFVCGQPNNPVNRAALDCYLAAHPGPKGVTFPDSKAVLAAGDPPLTEGRADCSRECLEWVTGIAFTPGERAHFRALQVDEWTRGDKPAQEGTLSDAHVHTQALRLPPADRELVRVHLLAKTLEYWRTPDGAKDPANRWLLATYDARNPSVAAGKPGPSRVEVDAVRELTRFRVREVSGDAAAADKAAKAVADRAAAGSAPLDDLRGAALQLALVRRAWPTLSETDRQELRDRWADDARLLGAPVKLAAWQTTPAPSKELAALDALRKLQQQQMNAAMASNMMRMQHQANMAVIRNIGSSSYRYEYKYEYRRR